VYAAEWDPSNPRKLTVATMSQREYSAWCAAGKPALKSPVAMVPKVKVDDMVRAAIDRERTNTQAALEMLASIIGEECGKNEKALRTEIDALRGEIGKLRDANVRSHLPSNDDVLDLPNWRSHHVEH
jgi:hypothetical protein